MYTGIEIIKRNDGEYHVKSQLNGGLQISYNDYGHLVLRIIRSNGDDIIVLSKDATDQVKKFISDTLCNKPIINLHVNNLHVDKLSNLPF